MKSHPRKALFLYALCLAAYVFGTVTARCETFPFTVMRDAAAAARAYLSVYTNEYGRFDDELREPTVRRQVPVDDDARILVAGGTGFHAAHSSTGHTLAWIMDRHGTVEHVWEYDPAIWSNLEHVDAAPLKSEIFPVGLHLYDDGSLLVNFQGANCWPYGVGLAKFDRNSRLIWKKELNNHHWFSVAEDGRIYAAAMRVADSPIQLGESRAKIVSPDGRIIEDVVMILDPDGNVLEEISMIDALVDSGWSGLFQGAADENIETSTDDPTHLNDVRVISSAAAAGHPLLTAGDVLLSFRNLNAIGILDPDTQRFKWMCAGATIRQHCPRIVGDGILLLDNRGGATKTGGSRLLSIDLETRLPSQVFPHATTRAFENPFYTTEAGHIDVASPDRALVALTDQSEIWEVDLETGKVLWEYVYVHSKTGERRPLYTAKYVRDVRFPFNRKKGPAL